MLNYSEHGTLVDNVFLTLDISDKPAHHSNHYNASLETAPINEFIDIEFNGKKDAIPNLWKNRSFLRKVLKPKFDLSTIKRENSDVSEIRAIMDDRRQQEERGLLKAPQKILEHPRRSTKGKRKQPTASTSSFNNEKVRLTRRRWEKEEKDLKCVPQKIVDTSKGINTRGKRKQISIPSTSSNEKLMNEFHYDNSRESLVDVLEEESWKMIREDYELLMKDSDDDKLESENDENKVEPAVDAEADNLLKSWKSLGQPAKMAANANRHWSPCRCDNTSHNSLGKSIGLECSVILKHGSLIQIGCLQFVFGISARGQASAVPQELNGDAKVTQR